MQEFGIEGEEAPKVINLMDALTATVAKRQQESKLLPKSLAEKKAHKRGAFSKTKLSMPKTFIKP